jgi:hypothetical protein
LGYGLLNYIRCAGRDAARILPGDVVADTWLSRARDGREDNYGVMENQENLGFLYFGLEYESVMFESKEQCKSALTMLFKQEFGNNSRDFDPEHPPGKHGEPDGDVAPGCMGCTDAYMEHGRSDTISYRYTPFGGTVELPPNITQPSVQVFPCGRKRSTEKHTPASAPFVNQENEKKKLCATNFVPFLGGMGAGVPAVRVRLMMNANEGDFPMKFDLTKSASPGSGRVTLAVNLAAMPFSAKQLVTGASVNATSFVAPIPATTLHIPYYSLVDNDEDAIKPLLDATDSFCEPFEVLPPFSCTSSVYIQAPWQEAFGSASGLAHGLMAGIVAVLVPAFVRISPSSPL